MLAECGLALAGGCTRHNPRIGTAQYGGCSMCDTVTRQRQHAQGRHPKVALSATATLVMPHLAMVVPGAHTPQRGVPVQNRGQRLKVAEKVGRQLHVVLRQRGE